MSNLILRPASFNELAQFANMAAKSAMVPPGFRNKPEDIMLAVQMGSELGLAPMQSLQNVAVINNRPAVWGDALIGLCRVSPLCEDIAERIEGEGDNLTAVCTAKRRGATPVTVRFSVADAKRAGLWGKAGPWQQYPQRMLQMRARGFALRDAFPDLLKGLITAEEARDIPPAKPDEFTGPTIEARAEPVAEPTPADKARDWAEGMITRLDAARVWEDVQALVGSPALAKGLEKLHGLDKAAAERLEAARQAAMDRAVADQPPPVTNDVYDMENAQ